MAFVDHAGCVGLVIDKDEELMPQKIHLQNCLVGRHGLGREGFGANDFLVVGRGIIKAFVRVGIKAACAQALGELGLVFADLTLDV